MKLRKLFNLFLNLLFSFWLLILERFSIWFTKIRKCLHYKKKKIKFTLQKEENEIYTILKPKYLFLFTQSFNNSCHCQQISLIIFISRVKLSIWAWYCCIMSTKVPIGELCIIFSFTHTLPSRLPLFRAMENTWPLWVSGLHVPRTNDI